MMIWPGEQEAWNILGDLNPGDVAAGAPAFFNARDAAYRLTCCGQDVIVSLRSRAISSGSGLGALFVGDLGHYSRLSILRYLIHARDLPLSGRLVRPADLPGGDIFVRGSHILPLERAAAYFSHQPGEFLGVARSLGGVPEHHGDLAVRLFPFPRVPVLLILWLADEEFPPAASLLLDSSCSSYLPPDIVWSVCMLAVEMMLIGSGARRGAVER
ncbi:MAG: DUF3786 domain-containing protein [Thermodesulfobacteriota bacterium]